MAGTLLGGACGLAPPSGLPAAADARLEPGRLLLPGQVSWEADGASCCPVGSLSLVSLTPPGRRPHRGATELDAARVTRPTQLRAAALHIPWFDCFCSLASWAGRGTQLPGGRPASELRPSPLSVSQWCSSPERCPDSACARNSDELGRSADCEVRG